MPAFAVWQAAKAQSILHDESRTGQARVLEPTELLAKLAELAEAARSSFASQLRKALAEDRQRVHAGQAALSDLDFGGRAGDPGFEQWKAWADLQRLRVTEFWIPARLGTTSRGDAARLANPADDHELSIRVNPESAPRKRPVSGARVGDAAHLGGRCTDIEALVRALQDPRPGRPGSISALAGGV